MKLSRLVGARFGWAVAVLVATACSDPAAPARPAPSSSSTAQVVQLALEPVVSGLDAPVYMTSPAGDRRLFIVERGGLIRIVRNGLLYQRPFLDVQALVTQDGGPEQGLLGLAFHPDFATNHRFFINYTDVLGDTRIVEYRVGTHLNQADTTTARLILTVDQPAANHNGGMLAFGPDGYLYIGLGDGGANNKRNGQRLNTLLGKILRIDVDGAQPYAVPSDNPFVGRTDARPEIWFWGVRNPWRFTFDRVNPRMYIGDVGRASYEEVNVVRTGIGGLNLGWPVMEGPSCFPGTTCDPNGYTLPVHWYDHSNGACSITGGYVYRGRALRELRGTYFFADFCSGVVQSFRLVQNQVTELRDWTADLGILPQISSFAEDANGELYIVRLTGTVDRIVAQ